MGQKSVKDRLRGFLFRQASYTAQANKSKRHHVLLSHDETIRFDMTSFEQLPNATGLFRFRGIQDICVKSVSSGKNFAAILSTDGRLFVCGNAPFPIGPDEPQGATVHRVVWNQGDNQTCEHFSEIMCGMYYMMAMTMDRRQLCSAGQNECGQRGIGRGGTLDFKNCLFRSYKREDIVPYIAKMACGYQHTIVLTYDGEMLGTGCSFQNQLGSIDAGICYEFIKLARPKDAQRIVDVQTGFFFSVCMDERGMVYTTGMLQHSNLVDALDWVMLKTFRDNPVERMTVSCLNSFFTTRSGQTYHNLNLEEANVGEEGLLLMNESVGKVKQVFGKECFFIINQNNCVFVSASNGAQGLPSDNKQLWIKHNQLTRNMINCEEIAIADAFSFCIYLYSRNEGALKNNLLVMLNRQFSRVELYSETPKNYFFDVYCVTAQ